MREVTDFFLLFSLLNYFDMLDSQGQSSVVFI
jgi:hypothetical protein